jgi:hypothetical protein
VPEPCNRRVPDDYQFDLPAVNSSGYAASSFGPHDRVGIASARQTSQPGLMLSITKTMEDGIDHSPVRRTAGVNSRRILISRLRRMTLADGAAVSALIHENAVGRLKEI